MPSVAAGMTAGAVNRWVAVIVGAVVGLTLAGALADAWLARQRGAGSKPRSSTGWWAVCLMLASYGLLIPGLMLNLFRADVAVSFFGITKSLVSLHESAVELVRSLADGRLLAGAILVATYAMVIPAAKVLLLLLSLTWQWQGGAFRIRWARRCAIVVRLISKWACPDMFAYILVTYLFRSLDNPPKLLSTMQLGIGFTCFCVFCVGSTISSLGIHVPEAPKEEARSVAAHGRRRRCAGRAAVPWGGIAAFAVPVLGVGFAALLALGLTVPCMELHLDMELLYRRNEKLKALSFIIDPLNLPELLHSEVSIWRCMAALARWAAEGDANCVVALVMYAVFAVLLPALDTAALTVAALSRRFDRPALAASAMLRKMCMLDVSIMGTLVTVLALANLRDSGVIIALSRGVLPLIGAELCRHTATFLLGHAASNRAASLQEEQTQQEKAGRATNAAWESGQAMEEGAAETCVTAPCDMESEISTCSMDSASTDSTR